MGASIGIKGFRIASGPKGNYINAVGETDFAVLAGLSRGLSGGDILNICLNAIHAGSMDADPEKWKVMQEMVEKEINKVRRAKKEHEGNSGRMRRMRRIGFVK